MASLNFTALLLSSALLLACGDKNTDVSSDDGPSSTDSTGSSSKDGGTSKPGKDGGGSRSTSDGGGGLVTPTMLVPTSNPFTKDATGGAGLSKDDLGKLKTGDSKCTAKILYPYDKTVFPAGLTPPTIMWEGKTDGAYLKLSYDKLDTLNYEAAAGPADLGELVIDPADWNEIVRRTQGATVMNVTLSTMTGGAVSTCNMTWKVAQGAMTGSVFFNTYNHPDNAGMGAVVRLQLGQPEAKIYLSYQGVPSLAGPCISCHSVSSDGSTMAASLHNYTPVMWSYEASSYTITADNEPMPTAALPESTFGGLTPDGSKLLSMGNPECTTDSNAFPRAPNNFPLVPGPSVAELHDTKTGAVVPANGLNPGWFMWMPQFSPRGDKVAFNHAKMGADGRTDRRELAVMDYDAKSNTFSNLKVVVSKEGPEPSLDYNPLPTLSPGSTTSGVDDCMPGTSSDVGAITGGSCTGPCYPAWPFFTPDGEGLVYTMISEPDFASAIPGRDTPSMSEVWYLDIETTKKVRLDTANKGLADDDPQANYYPTMLPVQVGGYYWLFWTSTRAWGHRDLSPTALQVAGNWFGGAAVLNSTKKRIWVSAIKPRQMSEVGLDDISDTSSPGFYLEGQTASGNVRAFATLNPCVMEGADCASGLDCCTGFCRIPDGADKGQCVPEKTCSDVNEKCDSDDDCCPAAPGEQQRLCVGEYCGFKLL
jgi:hypothetical protein